jgi:transposase
VASKAAIQLENERLRDDVVQRDARIAALRDVVASLEGKQAALESALVNHANEIELLKRRLFGPRSERTGTSELQLTLGDLLADEARLQKELEELIAAGEDPGATTPAAADAETDVAAPESSAASEPDGAGAKPGGVQRPKPRGRRDLSVSKLPKVVVEFTDPDLAKKGRFIGWDVSRQMMRDPGGFKVLVKRTAKYELPAPGGGKTVLGVEMPRTLFPRALLHTSVYAWLAVEKFALGVPHYRLEKHLACEAERLDRGTMCRAMEDLGNTLGATVVHAMLEDARAHCGVLSTDATGAAIQPGSRDGGPKQSCRKGHFFTIVADCDHVLFHYVEKHTSDAVAELFSGFSGFLQTDASSVYDILERGPPDANDATITLVGCWAHARRYFFEAAVCKYPSGIEGLKRIREIYRADMAFADRPPVDRKRLRLEHVMPLVDDFFAWVTRLARQSEGRNLATKALGYARNQEQELRRVLLDGRLPLDNTRSERELRKIVVGRKNWMFYGSDIHAQAAAAIFSIIASCRLHKTEPWKYLDELLRLLPHWPPSRYIELAPKNWAATRARLDPTELDGPLGIFSIPPAL